MGRKILDKMREYDWGNQGLRYKKGTVLSTIPFPDI